MLDYLSVLIFKHVATKGLYIYDTIYFIVAKLIKQVLKTIYNYTNYLPENNKTN